MGTAVDYDRATVMTIMNENQKSVRNMVLESYQDMLEGKGRDYKDFFAELESRYSNS